MDDYYIYINHIIYLEYDNDLLKKFVFVSATGVVLVLLVVTAIVLGICSRSSINSVTVIASITLVREVDI